MTLFLHSESRHEVIATCSRPGHGRCILTRSLLESKRKGKGFNAGGRPMGLVMAWSSMPHYCSQGAHEPNTFWAELAIRELYRGAFNALPGSERFTRHERPRREGEPEEPPELEC